jgi:hypothetical protein
LLAQGWNWNGHLVIPIGGINVYYIENNQKRYINDVNIVGCLGGYEQVIGVPQSKVAGWVDGPRKNDCNAVPGVAHVSSSPKVTVYSTSDRASSTVPDVQRKTIGVPPGYSYLGYWYRETTANPKPADGLWKVNSGVNNSQDEVWVETTAVGKFNFTSGIWIGVEFSVQYASSNDLPRPTQPTGPTTPGRGTDTSSQGGSTLTWINGSGKSLFIYYAVVKQGTTMNCDTTMMPAGSISSGGTWTHVVPSGQIGWFRFQRTQNACSERDNQFTTNGVGTPIARSETINIR